MVMNKDRLVVIRGAGDLATGIGHALHQGGFGVVMLEVAKPTLVRRAVSFGQAVYQQRMEVEGVTAQLARDIQEAGALVEQGIIPILIDPVGQSIEELAPFFLIDAIIAKRNLGTYITQAPVVIGVGPGFTAGVDVHLVVETQRGPNLGALYTKGEAAPDTGVPGQVLGYTIQRVIRSPGAGVFFAEMKIGQQVAAGDRVGFIKREDEEQDIPVNVEISGIIRGLLNNGIRVGRGLKIGDIDPRGDESLCLKISDKASLIGAQITKYCQSVINQG